MPLKRLFVIHRGGAGHAMPCKAAEGKHWGQSGLGGQVFFFLILYGGLAD